MSRDTVLITGASRGLGLELARQYAANGWHVIATCRNPDRASALRALAASAKSAIRVERLDVSDHAAIDALAGNLRETPIDLLLNNAGDIGPRDPDRSRLHEQKFGTLNYAELRRVFDVNAVSPLKMAEAFAEHVAGSRHRKMVFMSSTTGSNTEGKYATFTYCTSKAALNKIVTMLAMALRERGIICAAVCPGFVKTDMGGADATLEIEPAIRALRGVIGALAMADSGTFTRYDGSRIAW